MHLSAILSSLLALLILIPESSHGQYTRQITHIIANSLGIPDDLVSTEDYRRYDELKNKNGHQVLLDQMINITDDMINETEDGEAEVDLNGLSSGRSREDAGRRTRRRLPTTAAGKKGSMMGDMGKKGPGGKKGMKGCDICPEWSPARVMERAKKAKKESEIAGKKGSGSASPGGSSKKRRLNNDKNECCCDKDEKDCCCDSGKKGGGKKGDAAPPELKVELNLTTTFVNDEYTHQTPNLSYTYNGVLDFGGNMTGLVRMATTVDDSSCAGGVTTTEILIFDDNCGDGNITFNGLITAVGYAYIDFEIDAPGYPIDALMLAEGRGLCGLEDIKAVEFNSVTESVILTFTPAVNPLSASDLWD